MLVRYLLIHLTKRRCLSSLCPHSTTGDAHSTHLTLVRKRDILRTFYRSVVGTLLTIPTSGDSFILSNVGDANDILGTDRVDPSDAV